MYLKRPVVPFLHSMPTDILLPSNAPAPVEQPVEEEKSRTVGTQSIYRESDAQTDPFTPDYITRPGEAEPELLSLAHLKWGQGLPASLEEVNLIHRLREKIAFEKSLPDITDEASFAKRKRMLEEREIHEWSLRDAEMRKEQEAKLELIVKALREREIAGDKLADARLEKLQMQKSDEQERVFEEINRERIKATRALEKMRQEAMSDEHSDKRDIVTEHANFDSRVYAPLTREGRLPVKNSVVDYGIPLLSNYQGLSALEKTIVPSLKDTKIDVAGANPIKSRRTIHVEADLDHAYRLLLGGQQEKKDKVVNNMYKKFEPVQRAAMASVLEPQQEELDRAVLLVQRLLRGRAEQNLMFEGKQKYLQLIKELRISEQQPPDVVVDPIHALDNAVDTLQGEVIGQALDFISKEVVRVAEERRIAEMAEIAARTRRIREAEESGRRQAEELARSKWEDRFRGIMEEHSSSAGRVVENVVAGAIKSFAHNDASHVAAVKAEVRHRTASWWLWYW
jgi:hypothetical protein